MEINLLTEQIIGAAFTVHHELGPGLLESIYERCMLLELAERGLRVERQKSMPIVYKGRPLARGYRIDLLVEERVIVELKVVEKLDFVHTAQLLTYLKLSDCQVGLIINFNVSPLGAGIKRVVHNYSGDIPRIPRIPRLQNAEDE